MIMMSMIDSSSKFQNCRMLLVYVVGLIIMLTYTDIFLDKAHYYKLYSILGRIGAKREEKKALKSLWNKVNMPSKRFGKLTSEFFMFEMLVCNFWSENYDFKQLLDYIYIYCE